MNKLKLSILCMSILAATGCNDTDNVKEKELDGANSSLQDSVSTRSDFEKLAEKIIKNDIKGKSYLDEALSYVETQSEDGSWPDVIYDDDTNNNWSPANHLNRLKTMAFAYSNASNEDKNKTELVALKEGIKKGVDSWFTIKPVSKNWWWNEIGPQLRLGPVGLAMGDELSLQQRQNIASLMPEKFEARDEGANLTDKAKGILTAGILLKDADKVAYALKGIENSIYTSVGPGIQPDFSYHLHGSHLYNGSYGKVYINTALFYAHAVNDLKWRFAPEKNAILASYILDGDRWMTRAGTIDHQTRGRDISRKKSDSPSNGGLIKQLELLSELTPDRSDDINAYRAHLEGGKSGLNGFKHFYRSDYSTNMKDDFLFAIKMASSDVTTTESGNKENTLGYWLSHGSTALMLDGSEYRNIFPVWDWRYVPGVTSSDYQGPAAAWGKYEHRSAFVGGVSNGQFGITTMDMRQRGIRAKKTWFHFEDEIVALGAGIWSNQELAIGTTLEQSILTGPVIVDTQEVKEKGDHALNSDTSWVYHNNVGYVFPQKSSAVLSNKEQTGTWKSINKGQSGDPVSKEIFTLRVKHGVKPQGESYQYILLPATSVSDVETYSNNLPVSVVENTSTIQAVTHNDLKLTSAVFHQAGSVNINEEFAVAVDRPSALVIDQSQEEPVVSVATPGVSGGDLKVCINGRMDVFYMPAGAETGKTVTRAFKGSKGTCDPVETPMQRQLEPTDDSFVRGGHKFKDANYGSEAYLEIKAVDVNSDEKPVTRWDNVVFEPGIRESFLRWDLSSIDVSKVAKVEIILNAEKGDNTAKVDLSFHKATDSWNETEMTGWYAGSLIENKFSQAVLSKSNEKITIDVTQYAKDELVGDQILTLAIRSNNNDVVAKIATKEHEEPKLKPQLHITYK